MGGANGFTLVCVAYTCISVVLPCFSLFPLMSLFIAPILITDAGQVAVTH